MANSRCWKTDRLYFYVCIMKCEFEYHHIETFWEYLRLFHDRHQWWKILNKTSWKCGDCFCCLWRPPISIIMSGSWIPIGSLSSYNVILHILKQISLLTSNFLNLGVSILLFDQEALWRYLIEFLDIQFLSWLFVCSKRKMKLEKKP